jgi:hypothetical protein
MPPDLRVAKDCGIHRVRWFDRVTLLISRSRSEAAMHTDITPQGVAGMCGTTRSSRMMRYLCRWVMVFMWVHAGFVRRHARDEDV